MSDHEWVQDNIAAGVTGGLTPAERERLDRHVVACPDCAEAWSAAEQLDVTLGGLFADIRPGSMLEERTIYSLRKVEIRRPTRRAARRKFGAGIAAAVGLGVVGAGVSQLGGLDALPFPGRVAKGVAASAPVAAVDDNLHTSIAIPESRVRLNEPAAAASAMAQQLRERWEEAYKESADRASVSVLAQRNSIGLTTKSAEDSLDGWKQLAGSIAPNGRVEGRPAAGDTFKSELDITRGTSGFGYAIPPYRNQDRPVDVKAIDKLEVPLGSEEKGKAPVRYHFFNPVEQKPGWALVLDPKVDNKTDAEKRIKEGVEYIQNPQANPAQVVPNNQSGLILSPPIAEPAAPRKIVIRSGDIEFEVTSFDAAVATVTKLVAGINGAFVGTINSDKLPNGKVRGSIVVRVPPERLDGLVLDLRTELGRAGELKRLKIGSQDITKQYTDLESRLKAARTMEQRLLQMIKDGKGEIKQLLEAERELGVWRTKIEEAEGELRYYGNLVSLSTLTITMAEKEIRSAATLTESERVQAGIEVEDVDAARQQALAAVAEVKGRVSKSELKQLAAGQFNATLQFEVAPDAAGPIRDRLRQIGRIMRLEIDRVQQAEGGSVPRDAKVVRGDALFSVQFYNLANVAPRETATLQIAVSDVPASYQTLREAVAKANGRVLTAKLDEQDRQNVGAQLDFEVRRADEPALQAALAAAGELLARNVTRAVEGDNLTDAKVLFRATLVSAARLKPRETVALALEVPAVDAAMAKFAAQVAEAKGSVVDAQVAHERGGRVTARLIYVVPLAAASSLVERFGATGTVRMNKSARDAQAPDGRFATARIDVTVSNTDLIVASDDGLGTQIRRGLSYSASVLLMSVTWVVFGLCVVLPWAVIAYAVYRLFVRLFPSRPEVVPATNS